MIMRTPLAALLSGVLASLLFAGTAGASVTGTGAGRTEAGAGHTGAGVTGAGVTGTGAGVTGAGSVGAGATRQAGPVPTGNAALTDNPIYKTGKLELRTCEEQPTIPDDLDSSRVYLEFVMECLDQSWRDQFSKAKLPFSKPRLVTTSRIGVPTGCGKFPKGAQAVYCPYNKKITFLLDQGILSESTELFLLEVIAHEYGHHVQQLSGIMDAVDGRKYKNEKAYLPELRKIELQAECFSGAFIGSIWQSLNRRQSDFTYVLRAAYDTSSHGKAKNIAYWLTQGFNQEGPGACNTFSAPKSKVS
ncbi:neutral zinc metallopeptidase [Streptosporangium sp. NPDC000396]|uniref:neutral zinc metallopeptidase n=1 Tax=Streptosporangium sp. NPDC000396 TaxID=3366185 RepID=UPI0036937386